MEIIIDTFYNKFLNYKEKYNYEFLKEKISNFLKDTETKEKVFKYLEFNKTLDENFLLSDVFSKEEKETFFHIKSGFSMEKFKIFLKKLKISSRELEKEYFQSYVGFSSMMVKFGLLNNIEIADKILYLWVLVDNISDNPELKEKKYLLKNIYCFFQSEIYKNKEKMIQFFKKYDEDYIIKIFSDLYYLLEDSKRLDFFKTSKKLFDFSYTKEALKKEKNKSPKDLLKIAMVKTLKSLNIFSFCLKKEEKLFTKEEYFLNSLILQLADDMIDLSKDLQEGSHTFVTNCTIRERSVLFLVIMEINLKQKIDKDKYISFLFLSLIENKDLFEKDLFSCIKEVTKIDLKLGGYKDTNEFFNGCSDYF